MNYLNFQHQKSENFDDSEIQEGLTNIMINFSLNRQDRRMSIAQYSTSNSDTMTPQSSRKYVGLQELTNLQKESEFGNVSSTIEKFYNSKTFQNLQNQTILIGQSTSE